MVNKKAWIRIVEASIGILIIFTVIFSVSQLAKKTGGGDLAEVIAPLLEEIAKNTTIRESVIRDTTDSNEAE